MFFPRGGGFALAGQIFTDIVAGIVFIIGVVIVVGLLFVLVRFLLTATRAAELYIRNNTPAEKPVVEDKPATTTRTRTPPTTKPTP